MAAPEPVIAAQAAILPTAPRYQVGSTPILRNGVLYPPGSPIELTATQAARLGLAALLPDNLQLMPLETPGVSSDAN
jgi:hypothetical protein